MKFSGIFVLFVTLRSVHGGFWDFFSSSDTEKEAEVAASEHQQVYSVPLTPALPAAPIWRVHKYHGIDLRPVGPIGPVQHQAGWPPEALHLARIMGLEAHNLPPPGEIMNLLGVSSPEEALATIQEIAATPEGVAAMRSFLESRRPPPQPVYSLPALPAAPRLPPIHLPPMPTYQQGDYFVPAAAEAHPVTVLPPPPAPQRVAPYESTSGSVHMTKDIEKHQLALTQSHQAEAVSQLTSSGLNQ